jgi:hypothetical protein
VAAGHRAGPGGGGAAGPPQTLVRGMLFHTLGKGRLAHSRTMRTVIDR